MLPLLKRETHCWTGWGQRRVAETCSDRQKTRQAPPVFRGGYVATYICVADLLAWCWLAEEGMTSSLWRQGRWSIRMQRRAAEPLSIMSTKHMPFQLLTRSLCVDNRDRRFNPLTSTHTTIILQILILQILQTGCYGFEIGLSMSVSLLLTKTELLQIIFILYNLISLFEIQLK